MPAQLCRSGLRTGQCGGPTSHRTCAGLTQKGGEKRQFATSLPPSSGQAGGTVRVSIMTFPGAMRLNQNGGDNLVAQGSLMGAELEGPLIAPT